MILVTGANGQLGYDVIRELKSRDIECIGTTRKEFDIVNENEVHDYIRKIKPNVIIHCAAYTDVDRAEDEEKVCTKVNVNATEYIAKICREIDAKMIYISTDYVYDGKGNKPFEVDEHIGPTSVYGKTKYEGELKVQEILNKYFIVRISWVFGINGNNFVKTILRLGQEKDEINVVCDQIGSPTYTVDLAKLLCDMIETEKYGIYNASNEGFCSWAELAEEIIKKANLNCKINFIKTSQYPTRALRPFNSRMSKRTIFENKFNIFPKWKVSIKQYLEELINK